jgi:hypothetical protein
MAAEVKNISEALSGVLAFQKNKRMKRVKNFPKNKRMERVKNIVRKNFQYAGSYGAWQPR